MRNLLVVVVVVCLSVLCMQTTFALPAPEEMGEGVFVPEGETVAETGMGEREPRLTCNLPGALGDAACSAHCMFLGFSSGWCDANRICNCRK